MNGDHDQDINSITSLSSSTIFSNRADDDFESTTDSPGLHDAGSRKNGEKPAEGTEGTMDSDLNKNPRNFQFDSTARKTARKTSGAVKEENQESEGLVDGTTEDSDPFLKSVKYLEEHSIVRLFQNLAADIVYHRPDQPLQYIVEKLKKEKSKANDEHEGKQNEAFPLD
ncbi:hypothetical protein QZH41_014670 [Actinostola sp. cb2023]|nr:hypothetical protein QZH41_014670 [Actinostola sp. cb2023]